MAPMAKSEDPHDFSTLATHKDVQHAAASLSSTLGVVILILAGLTLAVGALWALLRRRRKMLRLTWPPTPRLIYESTIAIDMVRDDDEETIVDIEDLGSRASLETILSAASPCKLAFDFDTVLPAFLSRRKANILDRRGKNKLLCDTTSYYETHIVPTATKSPKGQVQVVAIPRAKFAENGATPGSPFWTKNPRPIYGFDCKSITPPVGSPLWSRRGGLKSAVEAGSRKWI